MFTREQFDTLLHLTMLQLEADEYVSMYERMGAVIWYIDSIAAVQLDDTSFVSWKKITIQNREYLSIPVDIQKNCEHTIAGNMIQIKFKRS